MVAASDVTLQDDPIGRFLAMAARRPGHPAIDLGTSVVTYAELEAMARRMAGRFVSLAGPGIAPRVVIALPKGPGAYAAMIGALLSGGCYIPLNVEAPERKLARIAARVEPNIIIAAPDYADGLAEACPGASMVDPAQFAGADNRVAHAETLRGPGVRGPTAYLIMTSGSTGEPKGVVISTRALAHYLDWLAAVEMFHSTDRVSQFPNIGFDVSVLDIYGALGAGSTLVPAIARSDRLFPADFVRRSRISVWVSVPSAIELVVTGRQATATMLGSVRLFAFCGEALRAAHLAAVFGACPAASVINMYGPTETTVTMTSILLQNGYPPDVCQDTVTIGDPIPGMGLHLVGGAHDDEGEIVVTGPQLATEYWNDPDRTARAFRTLPLGDGEARGYFTGDWGERHDRHIFFKGRIDTQMKIRGHRVEAGEIVARLAECGWPVACVLKHRDTLIAVVEAPDGAVPDTAALRARLLTDLEPHAVPEAIHAVTRMPRGINDKLDSDAVRALLDAAADRTSTGG